MVCTKDPALVIAPGLDQDNTAFEKMIFSDKLVNLKNKQFKRSYVWIKLAPLEIAIGNTAWNA